MINLVYNEIPPLTLKFGLLKHLDLADVDIMQRVDGLAGLLNVLANTVRDPGSQQHAVVNAKLPQINSREGEKQKLSLYKLKDLRSLPAELFLEQHSNLEPLTSYHK